MFSKRCLNKSDLNLLWTSPFRFTPAMDYYLHFSANITFSCYFKHQNLIVFAKDTCKNWGTWLIYSMHMFVHVEYWGSEDAAFRCDPDPAIHGREDSSSLAHLREIYHQVSLWCVSVICELRPNNTREGAHLNSRWPIR